MKSDSVRLAESLLAYCKKYPEQRFWQALSNWCGWPYIGVSTDKGSWQDTFLWIDLDGRGEEEAR